MYIGERRVKTTRGRHKTVLDLQCTQCGCSFERDFNVKHYRQLERHFCSFECHRESMKSGGPSDEARKESCRRKYGSDYAITVPEVARRAALLAHASRELEQRRWEKIRAGWKEHSIALRRGLTLTRSRAEVEFFDSLSRRFSVTFDTPRHANGWFIDGWCRERDVWVQFDGVYWHSSPRALTRDRAQDDWFSAQGMTLIRVTDREWKEDRESVLQRLEPILSEAQAAIVSSSEEV